MGKENENRVPLIGAHPEDKKAEENGTAIGNASISRSSPPPLKGLMSNG